MKKPQKINVQTRSLESCESDKQPLLIRCFEEEDVQESIDATTSKVLNKKGKRLPKYHPSVGPFDTD